MKIFILEDDPYRIAGFEAILMPQHDLTLVKWLSGPDGAYKKFQPPYDLILLDHDLGGKVYQISDGEEETGYKFVEFLPFSEDYRVVIVHSWNSGGAANMSKLLLNKGYFVQYEPFGTKLLNYLKEPNER